MIALRIMVEDCSNNGPVFVDVDDIEVFHSFSGHERKMVWSGDFLLGQILRYVPEIIDFNPIYFNRSVLRNSEPSCSSILGQTSGDLIHRPTSSTRFPSRFERTGGKEYFQVIFILFLLAIFFM
jgi:hypothetical protein